MWVLLVLGIFYWSLAFAEGQEVATLPGLGFPLDIAIVQGSAPAVLFLLLIITYSALRAYGAASQELGVDPDPTVPANKKSIKLAEETDESTYAIDLAAYTRKRSLEPIWSFPLFAYPAICKSSWLKGSSFCGGPNMSSPDLQVGDYS